MDYLGAEGYHPRSNKHGERLSQLVLFDLLSTCPDLAHAASKGRVVYATDFDVYLADPAAAEGLPPGAMEALGWNIDLVVGPPSTHHESIDGPAVGTIQAGTPATPWFVLDAKGVMTEHGKARRNRQRDAIVLSAVMHLFHPKVVVLAVIPVNIARKFTSPLRDGTTDHGPHIDKVVRDTVAIFRAVRSISGRVGPGGIDGLGCFVVDYENVPGTPATLWQTPPAPPQGDIIHYDRFIADLSATLTQRFGAEMG